MSSGAAILPLSVFAPAQPETPADKVNQPFQHGFKKAVYKLENEFQQDKHRLSLYTYGDLLSPIIARSFSLAAISSLTNVREALLVGATLEMASSFALADLIDCRGAMHRALRPGRARCIAPLLLIGRNSGGYNKHSELSLGYAYRLCMNPMICPQV